MHNAQPVTRAAAPELVGLVEQLARRAGLPMPKVYLLETDQPNAFATGRNPAEQRGRGHARPAPGLRRRGARGRDRPRARPHQEPRHADHDDHRDARRRDRLSGAVRVLLRRGATTAIRSARSARMLVMILAPLAAMLVQMAISRTREYSADRVGAEICGQPLWLARALQKIEQLARGVVNRAGRAQPGVGAICSSSIPCAWAGSTTCSAPIRRPPTACTGCARWQVRPPPLRAWPLGLTSRSAFWTAGWICHVRTSEPARVTSRRQQCVEPDRDEEWREVGTQGFGDRELVHQLDLELLSLDQPRPPVLQRRRCRRRELEFGWRDAGGLEVAADLLLEAGKTGGVAALRRARPGPPGCWRRAAATSRRRC